MDHARSAIAGVLSVGVVLLLVYPDPTAERQPERALAAFLGLLAIIALLVGVDVMAIIKPHRHHSRDIDDEDKKEGEE